MTPKTRHYLSRGIASDEFVEDLLGFGRQFGRGFGISVILAGKVERNVLLAELGHQEGSEGTQSVCREERKCNYTCVRGGNESVWLSAGARERLRVVLFCQRGLGGGIECNRGRLHLLERSFSKDCFHL